MKRKNKKQQFAELGDLIIKGKLPDRKPKRVRPLFKTEGDPREKAVQAECKGVLRSIGAFCFITTAGLLYNARGGKVKGVPQGTADIVGLLPGGRYIEVECKHRTGGYLSPEQYDHGIEITNDGGVYLVACSGKELLHKLAERDLIERFDL